MFFSCSNEHLQHRASLFVLSLLTSDYYLTLYLAGCLKTFLPNRLLPSNRFFRPKTLQSSHYKPKSATIAFFSSPPFVLLALSFSPFLFPRYCDSWYFWRKKPAFWPFSLYMTVNFVRFAFKKSARYHTVYSCTYGNTIWSIPLLDS